MSEPVLDASAVLAYLNAERGADAVEEALGSGARVGIVNWAEVLSKVAEKGGDPGVLEDRLERTGVLGQTLEVMPVTRQDALTVGKLRPLTKDAGLSLADRSCLALAIRLGVPTLTTDRNWKEICTETLGVEVNLIR